MRLRPGLHDAPGVVCCRDHDGRSYLVEDDAVAQGPVQGHGDLAPVSDQGAEPWGTGVDLDVDEGQCAAGFEYFGGRVLRPLGGPAGEGHGQAAAVWLERGGGSCPFPHLRLWLPGLPDDGRVEHPEGFGHVAGADFPGGQRPPTAVSAELGGALDGGGQRQRRGASVPGRLAAHHREDVGREAGDGVDGAAEEGQLLLAGAEAAWYGHAAQQDQRPVRAVGGEGRPCPQRPTGRLAPVLRNGHGTTVGPAATRPSRSNLPGGCARGCRGRTSLQCPGPLAGRVGGPGCLLSPRRPGRPARSCACGSGSTATTGAGSNRLVPQQAPGKRPEHPPPPNPWHELADVTPDRTDAVTSVWRMIRADARPR